MHFQNLINKSVITFILFVLFVNIELFESPNYFKFALSFGQRPKGKRVFIFYIKLFIPELYRKEVSNKRAFSLVGD